MTPQQLLDFEARHPERTRSKETAIRAELGMKPARYFQLLARAAESREGIAHDPITAARVRARTRDSSYFQVATAMSKPSAAQAR